MLTVTVENTGQLAYSTYIHFKILSKQFCQILSPYLGINFQLTLHPLLLIYEHLG